MEVMRLKLPELMEKRGIKTAYRLFQACDGRISISNAHNLVASEGRPTRIALATLQVLCDVLDVTPNELLESEPADARPKRKR
jgi:DNA-binding Xre family transcriptional regulator